MTDEKKPRPRGAPPLPRVFGRPPGAPSLNGHGPDVPKPADSGQKPAQSAENQPEPEPIAVKHQNDPQDVVGETKPTPDVGGPKNGPKLKKDGTPAKKSGRPKGSMGLRAKMSAARFMQLMKSGKSMPLDAMMEALQDALVLYRTARAKVIDEATRTLVPTALEHMNELKENFDLVMNIANKAAPYMHPKLATVDFVTRDETRQTVIRAPELIRTAKEWEEQNRQMGLLIDVTPDKDKVN